MDIVKEEKKDIVILRVDGKLDAVSAPEAEKIMSDVIDNGAKKIVIDMEKVSYISSAGLRSLLVAAKEIKAQKGKIVICSMTESVKKVFEISGFSTIFTTLATETEALKSF